MRIVITGALGQLGQTLRFVLKHHDLTLTDLPETDITVREAIEDVIHSAQAELVIHCAAYTDVDGCARNPKLAYQVNALGTQNIALCCMKYGAELLHVSTNEVFRGDRQEGYQEWMPLAPANSYGTSKAMAESYILNHLSRYYIVRTSWLYSRIGHNFIHAILNKARRDGEVRVVTDEIANPTYVKDLADAIAALIDTHHYGIYHFTNEGSCSRWEFANEIIRLAGLMDVKNTPIVSADYMRVSNPPAYAALHNINGSLIGITLRPWQEALADYISSEVQDDT
jgi:dTDP-4-dehydrorhamnose reductase